MTWKSKYFQNTTQINKMNDTDLAQPKLHILGMGQGDIKVWNNDYTNKSSSGEDVTTARIQALLKMSWPYSCQVSTHP